MRRFNKSMLEGPLLPSIILYTIPVILTSILQLMFTSVDMIVVGQYCGSLALGAVGATGNISALIVNLFIGLSVGCSVTIAHAIGAKEEENVHRIVHTVLPMALVFGAFVTVVGVFVARPMLVLAETPATLLDDATIYLKIYFGGITFTMIYNYCAAILRAAGDTRSPLLFLIISGVVHFFLNVLFVVSFEMGVAGVALSTVISQGLSAGLVVIALMRRSDACKLELHKIHIYKTQLLRMIRVGLPAGLQNILFAVSNFFIQSSINSFGDVVLAGHTAAGNPESYVYNIMCAFSQSAVNFIGQNCGAKQYDRVKKIFRLCMVSVAVAGLSTGILALIFRYEILGIFITDSDEAIQYGLIRMRHMLIPYFLCGMMEVSTGALRGLGESVVPMVISVLGICGVRILWVLTIFQIPQFHSLEYLYISYVVSYIVTLLPNVILFLRLYRKRMQASLSPQL